MHIIISTNIYIFVHISEQQLNELKNVHRKSIKSKKKNIYWKKSENIKNHKNIQLAKKKKYIFLCIDMIYIILKINLKIKNHKNEPKQIVYNTLYYIHIYIYI